MVRAKIRVWLLALCVLAPSAATVPAQAADKAIVAATPTALLLWLADALGYYKHLPIVLERHQSGIATGQALVDGKAQFATSSEFGFIARALARPDLRLVATLSSSQTAKLIGHADRVGTGAGGLRGKTLAVTRNSIGHFFLWQYLALNGLELSDVDLAFLAPNDIVAAMSAGTADAALTWQPFASRIANALDERAVFYPDQLDQFYYFSLYSTEAALAANAGLAADLLAATVKAETYAREEPAEAMQIVAKALDIEPAVMASIWPDHSLRVLLSQDLTSILELAASWRIEEGLSKGATLPNVLNLIEPAPLQQASPAAVQVIK